MNFKKAKKHLQKINRLYDNISEDGHLSSIERDLMLSYIREFYEQFLLSEKEAVVSRPQSGIKNEALSYKPIEEKKTLAPEPKPIAKPKVVEAPKQTYTPPPPPKPAPVVEVAPAVEPEPPVVTPPAKVVAAPPTSLGEDIVIPEFVKAPKLKPKTAKLRPEDEDLFLVKEATELSEKLSQTPIKDLNKAMGINDKIQVINELWGGNKIYFDEVIKKLNEMPNFDAAQTYLSQNVASKYDWANKKRQKAAKDFIKLVKRRYN